MKKKYIVPKTTLTAAYELPNLLAGTEQSPYADGKQSDFSFDSEDSDPWASGKDKDFDPWN